VAYDLTGAPDDAYVLSVVATDVAGNPSAATTSTYQLDTLAPLPPVVTAKPLSPSPSTTVAWSFTGQGTPACSLAAPDGSNVWGGSDCSSGTATYDLAGRSDGTYTFSVRLTDSAGNVSGAPATSYELDASPPGAPTLVEAPASPGRARLVSWKVEAVEGTLACELTAPGGELVALDGCDRGGVAADLTGREDGVYTLRVVAVDDAGNESAPLWSTYLLDTIAPASPAISSAPATAGTGRALTWMYTADEGTAECTLLAPDGTSVPVIGTCGDGRADFDLGGRPDGPFTFLVSTSDAAGNVSPDAAGAYVLDATGPLAPTIDAAPTSPRSPGLVEWRFSAVEGDLHCLLENSTGIAVAGGPDCQGGVAAYDLASATDGLYTFRVTATDAFGNPSPETTSTLTIETPTVLAAPTTTAPAPTTTGTTTPGPAPTTTTTHVPTTSAVSSADRGTTDPVPPSDTPPSPTPTTPATAGRPAKPGAARPAARLRTSDVAAAPTAAEVHGDVETAVGRDTTMSEAPRSAEAAPLRRFGEDRVSAGGAPDDRAEAVLRVAGKVAQRSTIPISLLLVVDLFLLVQDRVDRNDPKLALAPVYPDPELRFLPRPRSTPPGAARAVPSPGAA
jgi:hypothetical protein